MRERTKIFHILKIKIGRIRVLTQYTQWLIICVSSLTCCCQLSTLFTVQNTTLLFTCQGWWAVYWGLTYPKHIILTKSSHSYKQASLQISTFQLVNLMKLLKKSIQPISTVLTFSNFWIMLSRPLLLWNIVLWVLKCWLWDFLGMGKGGETFDPHKPQDKHRNANFNNQVNCSHLQYKCLVSENEWLSQWGRVAGSKIMKKVRNKPRAESYDTDEVLTIR